MAQPVLKVHPAHREAIIAAALTLTKLRALRSEQQPPPTAIDLAKWAGMPPDEWQQDLLSSTAQRILLNCSRQSGKSTMTGVLAVHTALTQPGSMSLLLSPTQRQSGELLRKCLEIYRGTGRQVQALNESALSLSLANGSRIVSLPGKDATVRGYSGVDLLAIDEAARVPGDLYMAVRPMLAVSGGRLIALSTPFGNRGWFYDAWISSDDWQRYQITATDCPRISPEFLEEERANIGEFWFRQEYECVFLDSQSQAFRLSDIDAAYEDVQVWAL
jgi:hypothetical protein